MKKVSDVRDSTTFNVKCHLTPFSVTLGFFDDIYVPRVYLPDPSAL